MPEETQQDFATDSGTKRAVDLKDLDAKLNAHEELLLTRSASLKPQQDMSALGGAMRVAADLIGGIVVGVAIGYGLAWLWPDYKVVFLALGFVLGIGIGMYNAWRAANATFGKPRATPQDEPQK